MGEGAERNFAIQRGPNINIAERTWAELEIRLCFQNHAILVQLGEHDRDLSLPESIVERVVDQLRSDAQTRRSIPVNHQARLQSAVLLIAGHVAQLRLGLKFLDKPGHPGA